MSPGGLDITPQLFVILAGLVEERLGLHYGPDDRVLFGGRVGARAAELGYESLLDYYYFLKYDDPGGEELAALADALVVNETYLFREAAALHAIVDLLLPTRLALRGRARIWSAACSTGEEPVSLAMLLAGRGLLDRVEIVASDLSDRALGRAREGRLGARSIRDPSTRELVGPWLVDDGRRVSRSLLDAIRWEKINLTEPDEVARIGGPFDIVLLRNVLIYFSDDTTRRVLANVERVMAPDGVLVVGASESLLRLGTNLRLEQHGGAFVYRRGGGA